jgi:hypothetical protein
LPANLQYNVAVAAYFFRYDERVRDLLDFSIYLDISDEVKFAWKIQVICVPTTKIPRTVVLCRVVVDDLTLNILSFLSAEGHGRARAEPREHQGQHRRQEARLRRLHW